MLNVRCASIIEWRLGYCPGLGLGLGLNDPTTFGGTNRRLVEFGSVWYWNDY